MFFRAMGRLTVRFLAGLGRVIGGIFKSIVRHPIGTIFTVLIVGGLVYLWTSGSLGINLTGASDSSVVTQEASTQASGKSEDFLNAFGKLDANGMWNIMNDNLRKAQQASGIANAGAMQKAINDKITELVKDNSKPKYQFEWNNGRTKSDGTATDIFVGTTSWPSAGDKLPKTVIYIITTDKDGKVQEAASQMVKTPDPGDPIMSAAFPSKKAQSGQESAGAGTATSAQNPTTIELMAGLTNFDAKRVWNTFSPAYQKELTDKKVTPDTMQATFDSFKKDAQTKKYKLSYVGYSYQVTTNYTNDFTTDVYVSALQVDDSVMQFGYIILLDKTGKVVGIGSEGSEDPILSKALGRSQSQGQ